METDASARLGFGLRCRWLKERADGGVESWGGEEGETK